MRPVAIIGMLALTCGVGFAATQPVPTAPEPQAKALELRSDKAKTQVAQVCGFFAILGCYGSRAQAEDWNDRIQGGYVINTSSAAYPNFRPGYYCVVNGPTSEGHARAIARGWRSVVPDSYAKSSC